MENNSKIVPPHLNAEVYRTDTTGNEAPSYLDYIKLHPGNFSVIKHNIYTLLLFLFLLSHTLTNVKFLNLQMGVSLLVVQN